MSEDDITFLPDIDYDIAWMLREIASDLDPYMVGEVEQPSLNCAASSYLRVAAAEIERLRAVIASQDKWVPKPYAETSVRSYSLPKEP